MSEKTEVARDGGTLHKNSGRGVWQKGDATVGPFCVDYKEYAETFGVSRTVWAKCSLDAWRNGAYPALKLVLGTKSNDKIRLWVISDEMFHEMLSAWEERSGTI